MQRGIRTSALLALALSSATFALATPGAGTSPYGLTTRVAPRAYLGMPEQADGKLPPLLSETGAFSNTPDQIPSRGLIPYEIVVPFWSDGARKLRWVAVPKGRQIHFAPTGEWGFPNGTVFVKTFELPIDERHPELTRRLETRLLVRDSAGGVYGVVYKWRADGRDADLLTSSLTEQIPIRTASGAIRLQTWYYPSRKDCHSCHTDRAGGVLGVKTRQMNRDLTYPSGVTDNELRAWNHIGLFTPAFTDLDLRAFSTLAATDDTTRTLEDRARSYLDANCAQCHRPGGTAAYFDARYDTPLDKQELVDGPILYDQGIDRPRVISPHDIWRSIALMRMDTVGDIKMPPLARETIDERGVALMRDWILSMPGRDVVAPPVIAPAGGTYPGAVEVSLKESEPGAEVHYTLDGSVPGKSDPRYEGPIELKGPTVLRARAFKDGFTRSIPVQEVFIIGK